MHTWLTEQNLKNTKPLEAYFAGLYKWLKSRGEDVFYMVHNLTSSKTQGLRDRFSHYPENFIFLEEGLSLPGLIFSGFRPLFNRPAIRNVMIENRNVTPIIDWEISNGCLTTRHQNSLSYFYFFKELRKYRCEVKKFIYTFENQTLERAALLGLRKFHPGVQIIGHQHSPVGDNLLNLNPHAGEREILPLPDRLVSHGPFGTTNLKRKWKNHLEILEGPAFIQSRIFGNGTRDKQRKINPTKEYSIGVATSASFQDSEALLTDLWETFKENFSNRILVKYHPCLSPEKLEDFLEKIHPGTGRLFKTFDGNTCKFLEQINILILNPGSMAVEAACMGIKIIYYLSLHQVRLNYIEHADYTRVASSPRTLQQAIHELNAVTEPWKDCPSFDDYYAPVSQSTLSAFEMQ